MNALTHYETPTLHSFDDMLRMAGAMAESKLFGIQTPQQYLTLMLVAQSEGQHPATVVQDYDIIQGRPARKTHSVLARFQAAGGSVQWHDFTEEKVSGTFTHPKGGSLKIEWTIDMAARAGLSGKDNWKKTPRAMLRARCIAEGVRATYPAALGGQLIVEEAADLPPASDIAPTQFVERVEPARSALPAYTQADFAKNLPAWTKLVADGKKTASDLLATLSTRATFSEEQRAAVLALKPKQAEAPPPADTQPGPDPFVTDMEAAEGAPQ